MLRVGRDGEVIVKIILVDTNPSVVAAWKKQALPADVFVADPGSILGVVSGDGHFVHGDPIRRFTFEPDAVVSPANSFGFMDGGIDQVYTDFFGPGLQRDVQQEIAGYPHLGELLVGQALVKRTGHPKVKFCVIAPTMRVPMPIVGTVNAYLATRAAVRAALSFRAEIGHGMIETLAIPGMGTGAGRLGHDLSAFQVVRAIADATSGRPFPATWREAAVYQWSLEHGQEPR